MIILLILYEILFPGNIIIKASIVSIVMSLLYQFFIANPLKVGYSRFFLENMNYHKTKYSRLFFAFNQKNYISSIKTLGLATLYKDLWNLTIVGGIIKKYSYRLVPFIVAENSEIKPNNAITLSRHLMYGYKFKAFLLDFSFIGWEFLNLITFGLLGIFFLNPYTEGANAEFYKNILITKKEKTCEFKPLLDQLNDKKLYINESKDYYPSAEPASIEFACQHYSPLSLGLMFFIFSAIGWVLEVSLFLLKTHIFINRGVLFGPWLPIYGTGCVLIILVFVHSKMKKYLTQPLLLFLLVMILCGLIEYSTSFVLELVTGLEYWNYEGHFLNINGRICLEGLIEFGLGGLLCIYFLAPKLNNLFNKCNKKFLISAFIVLLILFIGDSIYSRFNPNIGYGITESIYTNIN